MVRRECDVDNGVFVEFSHTVSNNQLYFETEDYKKFKSNNPKLLIKNSKIDIDSKYKQENK